MKLMNRCIAAATLLCAALGAQTLQTAQAAPASSLQVALSVPAPMIRGDVDVVVNVAITNTSREAVSVLRWELPSSQPENAMFRITRDGQPVAYTGRMVKRAAPTAADYVRIEAGATLNFSVELTGTYELAANGTYAIEYAGVGQRELGEALRSQALYVWLDGRTARAAASTAVAAAPNVISPIIFTGNCSASQQTILTNAANAAQTYAQGAVNYFNTTRGVTPRFAKWFGATPPRTNWNLVRTHYTAILDAFANKQLTLDCSCTQAGTYAYVFANAPYKIYACPVFWQVSLTGTDSQAGTLIHEMSHFTVVAGTQDYVYGQSGAAALAISNPANAVMNADNHEYFAENTPVQP